MPRPPSPARRYQVSAPRSLASARHRRQQLESASSCTNSSGSGRSAPRAPKLDKSRAAGGDARGAACSSHAARDQQRQCERHQQRHRAAPVRAQYGGAFPIPSASEALAARVWADAAAAAAQSCVREPFGPEEVTEALRAMGHGVPPETARLLGLPAAHGRPTCYKLVAHVPSARLGAQLGLRPGFYSMDGRIEFRLGHTSSIEGERAAGRGGEDGCGGFFIWSSVESALAAAFSPGARLFEAPRALLRVYAAGAACPVRPDGRFAAAVDERKCVPLVTPVAVVAKGKTLLALYSRFLGQGGPLKTSRDAQALGGVNT